MCLDKKSKYDIPHSNKFVFHIPKEYFVRQGKTGESILRLVVL